MSPSVALIFTAPALLAILVVGVVGVIALRRANRKDIPHLIEVVVNALAQIARRGSVSGSGPHDAQFPEPRTAGPQETGIDNVAVGTAAAAETDGGQ